MGAQVQWDSKMSKMVAILASLGLSIKSIASIVNLADKTLSKVYGVELKTKTNLVSDHIKAKIVQKALAGDNDMLKHYSKCQMNWTEKSHVDHDIKVHQTVDRALPETAEEWLARVEAQLLANRN